MTDKELDDAFRALGELHMDNHHAQLRGDTDMYRVYIEKVESKIRAYIMKLEARADLIEKKP